MSHLSLSNCGSVIVLCSILAHAAAASEPDEPLRHFEQQIRPLLASKCVKCHGEKKQEGGLRLDTRAAILTGGESGPAVEPGDPAASLLLEAVRYESFEMPPTGQLSERSIQHFEAWIAAGAAWPAELAALREDASEITDEDRSWWAFQALQEVAPPVVADDTWSHTEIDRFVLKALRDRDMEPAPAADKQTLLRRLYFDLIGVPPSKDEIDAFLSDSSDAAWESTVDRLLHDRRYGEHWARYWLDLVRYCESDGWNQDAYRPHIWRYRDYVVESFNTDKPYPEFVREQLAGDEIEGDDPEHLVATGFLRLGIYEYNQRDARGHWNDIMNETTDVAGDVFLGLSMACARCHDHKFDPIPQKDYFQLRAFFEPVVWRDDLVAATEDEQTQYQQQLTRWEDATADVRARIDALIEPYYDEKWKTTVDKFPLDIQACFHMPETERTSWQHQMAYLVSRQFMEEGGGPLKAMSKEDIAKHEALQEELAAFDQLRPAPLPAIMAATDFTGLLSPTVIPEDLKRHPVQPGFLSAMADLDLESQNLSGGPIYTAVGLDASPVAASAPIKSGTSGRRSALAKWIADPRNPLTTRVIVNRIWQQHFGQGLVATPSDFGKQGQLPSHPELLDWLTATFIEEGWSFKKLHKRIVMSSTWQQSALHPQAKEQQAKDPEEQLLWRWRVRRLQAEQIRDAMLAASGELDGAVGGPSVEEETPRRALYIKSFRNNNDTFLHGFDMANGLKSVAIRDTTTTPIQALLLINGKYALDRAEAMAQRMLDQSQDVDEVLTCCFQLTWSRHPSQQEMEGAREFLGVYAGEESRPPDLHKLADFCHVLFNSNQFLYLE